MEYIKQYAFSICVSGIVATIMYMLIPSKSISKVLKTAISVFFLSSLLSPFLIDIDIIDEIEKYSVMSFEQDYKELENDTNRYVIEQFELKIKELILSDLKSLGVDPVNVTVSIDEDEIGNLFVSDVKVFLTQSDMRYQSDVFLRVKNITVAEPQIYLSKVD